MYKNKTKIYINFELLNQLQKVENKLETYLHKFFKIMFYRIIKKKL